MHRWLLAFIVALVLPCYAFALVQPHAIVAFGGGHADAALSGDARPAHEDGADSADPSGDVAGGLQADATPDGDELVDGVPALTGTRCAEAPSRTRPASLAAPFLEGLRRPPRDTATR